MEKINQALEKSMILLSDDGSGKVAIAKDEEAVMFSALSLLMNGVGQYPSTPELDYDINDAIRREHNEADQVLEEVRSKIKSIISKLYPKITFNLIFERLRDDKGVSYINTNIYLGRVDSKETKTYNISLYENNVIK